MQMCVVEHFIDNLPVVEVVDNTAEVELGSYMCM